MREIKFRAWHTVVKQMFSAEEMGIDQLTLMPNGQGFINVSSTSTRLSQFITEMIPLQFTGLKDKNGAEIYEGDILKCWDDAAEDESWGLDKIHIGVIEFNANSFCLKVGNAYLSDWSNAENIEVIGNIYQNPELITKR